MQTSARREFIDPQVLSKLSGLSLHARFPMLGNVSGRHRSPIRGSSIEFAEYRKYVPGDDTRRLDWRAYGRSDRFYIKEFEADTNLRLCLVVDTSGSMGFGEVGLTKFDYARRLAGTLAWLAVGQGDAAGLYCAGRGIEKFIPPKRNATHLRTLLDELTAVETSGETGLVEALHEAAERIPQRALVVVISDLFLPPAELSKAFQHLRFRRHDVTVFHLLDQQEIDFSFDRPMRFLDMEGGQHLMADPSIVAVQYRRSLQAYLSELKGVVRDAAIDYHRVSLSDDYAAVLAGFLLGRTPRAK
jgi:uncharacterized protein (DUF58 family)